MSIYQSIMGHTWVYDRLRPMVLGGLDYSAVYKWLQCTEQDIVVDIGCGTGHAMNYLDKFKAYHGFDTDQEALNAFRRKHPDQRVDLTARTLDPGDLKRLRPTKALAIGLLHHLNDGFAGGLLKMLAACESVQRVVTLDTVYLPGRWTNNCLAFMDRGRFTRKPDGYRALAKAAGLAITRDELVPTGNHIAWYQGMCLEPAGRRSATRQGIAAMAENS